MDTARPGVDALHELRTDRRDTLDRLMPVVYDHLRLTARTVQRDWAKARMLLRRAMSP